MTMAEFTLQVGADAGMMGWAGQAGARAKALCRGRGVC
jgi:hypothetical protein